MAGMDRFTQKANRKRFSKNEDTPKYLHNIQRQRSGCEKTDRDKRKRFKKQCFKCGTGGHRVSDCPFLSEDVLLCYKCGSLDHMYRDCKLKTKDCESFPFAKCFICGEMGHITSRCSQNPNGIYKFGGECRLCSSKFHLWKDCPTFREAKEKKPKEEEPVCATLQSISGSIECEGTPEVPKSALKKRVVTF